MRGQVVLITGGSRGLGLLMAREFASLGCRIVICARDEETLARARDDLRRRGADVLVFACDVGDREQVRRLIADTYAHHGRIDVLVNNAGVIQVAPLEDQTLADFEQAARTMYWGVVYPSLAVLPLMRARRSGQIVNVTSIGGKVSVPHLLPYSAAKFAAVGFSDGLRAELSGTGVSVTTVVPGLMRTGSHLHALFGGKAPAEATWFALGATLPLVTVSGEHAARAVVNATLRRQPTAVIGLPARGLMWMNGLFPGLTARLLGRVDRLALPDTMPEQERAEGHRREEGWTALRRSRFPLLGRVTTLGQRAALRANQFPPEHADRARPRSSAP